MFGYEQIATSVTTSTSSIFIIYNNRGLHAEDTIMFFQFYNHFGHHQRFGTHYSEFVRYEVNQDRPGPRGEGKSEGGVRNRDRVINCASALLFQLQVNKNVAITKICIDVNESIEKRRYGIFFVSFVSFNEFSYLCKL